MGQRIVLKLLKIEKGFKWRFYISQVTKVLNCDSTSIKSLLKRTKSYTSGMCTISVENLPKEIKEVDLRSIFSRHGRIGIIVIKLTEDSTASALITLSGLEEGRSAVKSENQKALNKRVMRVSLLQRTPDKLGSGTIPPPIIFSAADGMHPAELSEPPPRETGPRQSLKPVDEEIFEFPFDVIQRKYEKNPLCPLEKILKGLPGQPMYQAGPFPNNIRHWIWAKHEGDRHRYIDESWNLLCQLDNDLFAYFHVGSDLTYPCEMSLYLSPDPSILLTCAMTDKEYRWYKSESAPAASWSAWDAETTARRLAWAMLDHLRLGEGLWSWLGKDVLKLIGSSILAEKEREVEDTDDEGGWA